MARLLSGLALLIFLISCGERLPEGIVSKRVMPDLLFDIHLLDGQLSTMTIDSARRLIDPAYESIFKRYKIDSVQFKESLYYYAGRPTEMAAMYKELDKRLKAYIEEDQQQLAAKYKAQMAADSLRAIRIRDSVYWRNIDSLDWLRRRHLLLRHEADSTIDRPVPVTPASYYDLIFRQTGLSWLNNRQLQTAKPDSITPLPPLIPLEPGPLQPVQPERLQ